MTGLAAFRVVDDLARAQAQSASLAPALQAVRLEPETCLAASQAIGPLFGFSQQWQIVINSFTTIVTFLMVFVIQNTQNRDFRILRLKLTEPMRVSDDSLLLNVEWFSDEELIRIERALKKSTLREA